MTRYALMLVAAACASTASTQPDGSSAGSTARGSNAAATTSSRSSPASRLVAKPGPMQITAFIAASRTLPTAQRTEFSQPNICFPAVAILLWRPIAGASRQRVQLVPHYEEFVGPAVLESQDLDPGVGELSWPGVTGGSVNFWRVISDSSAGWVAGPALRFQAPPIMPCDQP